VDTRAFNKTTEGLIKAAMQVAAQNQRRATQPPKHPKYRFERAGSAIHAKNCIAAVEREAINSLTKQMREAHDAGDNERFNELLAEIQRHPVRFVPIKRAHLQVYGKTYDGPGKKERERAARRVQRLTPQLQEAA